MSHVSLLSCLYEDNVTVCLPPLVNCHYPDDLFHLLLPSTWRAGERQQEVRYGVQLPAITRSSHRIWATLCICFLFILAPVRTHGESLPHPHRKSGKMERMSWIFCGDLMSPLQRWSVIKISDWEWRRLIMVRKVPPQKGGLAQQDEWILEETLRAQQASAAFLAEGEHLVPARFMLGWEGLEVVTKPSLHHTHAAHASPAVGW